MKISQKVAWRQRIISATTFLCLLGLAVSAMALPKEMEADRLLISAGEHLGSPEATEEFKKIRNLNIKLPTEYYYYYGKHLYETGNLKEANKNMEKYLEKAGRKGQFYQNSLQVLTAIEKDIERLSRFVDHGDGTVTDTKTGLMWAAKDNGKDIKWPNAKSYCENYRGGGHTDWRLPTADEMANLYDPKEKNRHGYHITKLIDLSYCGLWASETRGSSEAASFAFKFGRRRWNYKFLPFNRALPVRAGN